jgi:hypothetical protein
VASGPHGRRGFAKWPEIRHNFPIMQAREFEALIAGLEGRGLTRSEIASQTGLSRMTIWRFANGMAREPSHRVVSRLETFAARSVPTVSPLIQKTR